MRAQAVGGREATSLRCPRRPYRPTRLHDMLKAVVQQPVQVPAVEAATVLTRLALAHSSLDDIRLRAYNLTY